MVSVKDGKIDVTQQTEEEAKMDAELSKGVGTVSVGSNASSFAYMLAQAGVQKRSFSTNVSLLTALVYLFALVIMPFLTVRRRKLPLGEYLEHVWQCRYPIRYKNQRWAPTYPKWYYYQAREHL